MTTVSICSPSVSMKRWEAEIGETQEAWGLTCLTDTAEEEGEILSQGWKMKLDTWDCPLTFTWEMAHTCLQSHTQTQNVYMHTQRCHVSISWYLFSFSIGTVWSIVSNALSSVWQSSECLCHWSLCPSRVATSWQSLIRHWLDHPDLFPSTVPRLQTYSLSL